MREYGRFKYAPFLQTKIITKGMLTLEQAKVKVHECIMRLYGDNPMIVKHGLSIYNGLIHTFERGWIMGVGPTPAAPDEPPISFGGGIVVLVDKYTGEMIQIPSVVERNENLAEAYMQTYDQDIETIGNAIGWHGVSRIE